MNKLLKRLVIASSVLSALTISANALKAEQPVSGGTLIYLDKQVHNNLYSPLAGTYTNGGILNQITDRLTYHNPQTL